MPQGSSADGQPATLTDLGQPVGLAFDAAGNLYFSALDDSSGADKQQVRRIDRASGLVSEILGFDIRVIWGAGSR